MSKFTFALPNGKFFELSGPAGATVAQAEKIFLQQLAAGAIVGLSPGDVLQSPEYQLIKFTQTRLDRGIAGTSDLPLLAINNQGILSTLPLLTDIQVKDGINTADFLDTQPAPPVGPLTPAQVQSVVAQVAKNVDQQPDQITQEKGVGKYGFNLPQLEKVGLLKPGTSCRCTGLPPLAAQAAPNPPQFENILRSPSVWTGQDNVRSVRDILSNPGLQDRLQARLVQQSYSDFVATGEIQVPVESKFAPTGQVFGGGQDNASLLSLGTVGTLALGLLSSGALTTTNLASLGKSIGSVFSNIGSNVSRLISGAGGINLSSVGNLSFEGVGGALSKVGGSISTLANRGVADLGGLLANASKFGTETATAWAKGLTPGALTSQLDQLSKQGQFAINFSDFKIPNVVAGTAPAAAFKGTVNRSTVDSTFVKLLGSNKIPVPELAVPANVPLGFDSLEPAMNSASALLKNTTNLAGQIPALAGGLTSNLANPSLLQQAQGSLAGGVLAVPGVPDTGALTSMGSSLEQNLYSRAPDSDLIYTGSDSTVWDRVNAERLRRGLPGLAAIGYPKPDGNMVVYT